MTLRQWIYLVSLLLLLPTAHAQQSTRFGDHEVHYIAYNSSFLNPEVAEIYGITRSKNLAMVNLSIQKGDVVGEGLPAEVSGTVTNIMHQVIPLEFREIREGDAIYYVSAVRFNDGDVLTFKVDAKTPDADAPFHVQWQQKFWR